MRLKNAWYLGALAAGAVAGACAVAVDAIKNLHLHVRWRTLFGPALVADILDDEETPVRVLVVGSSYQSASYLNERRMEPVFAYYRAFDVLFQAFPEHAHLCMVGGGAYSFAKHALSERADVSMDVVEIDPAITELAKRYFFLDELIERHAEHADAVPQELPGWEPSTATVEDHGRLRLVCADGRAWLERSDERYDAIINDAFSGSRVPGELSGEEMARVAAGALEPGGLYLVNVVASGRAGEELRPVREAAEALARVFAHVWIVPAADDHFQADENYVLVASDGAHELGDALPYEA